MTGTEVAAWLFNEEVYCTNGLCLPDDFKEAEAAPVFFTNRDGYERGLVCCECKDDIFPDTWKIVITNGDEEPLVCSVEVKRYKEGDKHPVWNGKAYTAKITLVDFDETEEVTFWTECIYHPSPSRAFYDLREMLGYSEKADYPTPFKLLEEYRLNDVHNAVLFTSRWYESRFLRIRLEELFGSWFKSFIAGDCQGEVD